MKWLGILKDHRVIRKSITSAFRRGNSLVVRWLGLGTFIAVALIQSLLGELRSHKPQAWPKRQSEVKWSESCSVMSNSLRPYELHRLCSPWDFLGQNTGVGSFSLFQGIFPTQGLNPGLPHCKWILYQLRHKGSPRILEWVAYPFFIRSSQPKNGTGVSCLPGRFFTNWAIREAHKKKDKTAGQKNVRIVQQ